MAIVTRKMKEEDAKLSERISIRCDCGGEFVVRRNGRTLSRFLGCDRYPRCTRTRTLPEFVKLEEAGAVRLPGF